jgi:hypothetical protein
MGSVIYTTSQLLALRHSRKFSDITSEFSGKALGDLTSSYFALWAKYNRLRKEGPQPVNTNDRNYCSTVYRYDFALSNKEFKRRWVKTQGTPAGLKDQRRIPITVFSVRVKFLEQYFKQMDKLSDLLSKLLRKIHLIKPEIAPPVKVEKTDTLRYQIPARRIRPFKRTRLAAIQLRHLDGITFAREIGGLVWTYDPYKPPPLWMGHRWQKYFYFFRIRGFWRPSEHHPYGDEYEHLHVPLA